MYSNGNDSIYEVKFSIPNLYIGCFVIQSVLQSTLECFFNQTCLDTVQGQIFSERSINISILDISSTQFPPQTFIGTLVDVLMVEQWGRTVRYDQYYVQCAPKLCLYTFSSHNNAFYVFTRLLSLIGGLTVAIKVIVQITVGWIRKRMRPAVPLDNTIGKLINNKLFFYFLMSRSADTDCPYTCWLALDSNESTQIQHL